MQMIKGRPTRGYGESAIKVHYPDGNGKDFELTLLCNNHRLGKIILDNLQQVYVITEALGNNFRVIPSSGASKYRI